jgi:hypothetical protein
VDRNTWLAENTAEDHPLSIAIKFIDTIKFTKQGPLF